MRKYSRSSISFVKVIVILIFVFILLDISLRFLFPSKQIEFNVNRPVEYQELFIPNRIGQLKPNLDETVAFSNTTFSVKTNSLGLRSPATNAEKTSGVTRIAVLGDSVSFGWLMEELEAYPAILRDKLNEEKSQYEVINFSAPGLSSLYGKSVYDSLISKFKPDILILSFGLYDAKLIDISDTVYLKILEQNGFFNPSSFKTTISRFSSLGNWWFSRSQNEVLQYLTDPHSRLISSTDSKTDRVNSNIGKEALEHMISQQQSLGGETILLDANINNHHFMNVMNELHTAMNVNYFSIYEILSQSGGEEGRKLRYQKQLAYPGITKQVDENVTLQFRIYAADQTSVYLRTQTTDGNNNQWFDLNDAGKNGDEKAGDNVWSISVQIEKPADLFFKYYDKKTEEGNMPLSIEPNVWLLKEKEQSQGFLTTMPLVINGKLSHQEFRMPENLEYPGKELHRSIANRLYYLIKSGT